MSQSAGVILDRYVVVGNPVAHSLSPQIHQAFALQTGEAVGYERLQLEPTDFVGGITEFFQHGGAGANVTVPFKQQAFAWCDRCDGLAEAAGAVNTLVPDGPAIVGHNTDGIGLVRDLTRNLGIALDSKRVLLLGAGGAARGVLAPLLAAGVGRLIIANRTHAKAQSLVAEALVPNSLVPRRAPVAVPVGELQGDYDLVINATAASLAGSGAIVAERVLENAHCYDMMYGPETAFCQFAEAAGASQVHDGIGMLVEQAAAAFELWRHCEVATEPVLGELRSQGLARAL